MVRADHDAVVQIRSDQEQPATFLWQDIEEIQTFKRDLITYDVICLSFRVASIWYEFWESDAGFQQLAKLMQAKFLSIPVDWYDDAMQPPFATNQRTLWQRG